LCSVRATAARTAARPFRLALTRYWAFVRGRADIPGVFPDLSWAQGTSDAVLETLQTEVPMNVGIVQHQVSSLLDDYLESFGMTACQGPLRAMGELVRGLLWTGSVQLTNAARLFADTPEQLAQAVKRLSVHLANPRWDHREWAAEILAEQARHVRPQDLVPLDATELAKPYARKMPYQTTVRDASRVGHPLVSGYWCWGAYHWDSSHGILAPLLLRPYSPEQPMFLSENDTWCRCLQTLREATAGRGVWLQDRGADRPEVLAACLRLQKRWIIRLRKDRALLGPDGERRPAGFWADWALSHAPERDHAVALAVRLPPKDVPQDQEPPLLRLVVPTYRFADGDRWLLLTRGVVDSDTGPGPARRSYGLRWRGEDAKRLLGQIWHVERFLVRSWVALERLLWCVVAAAGFQAFLQRDESRLAQELQQEVLYRDKPCAIPGYRLARGLQAIAQQTGHVAMLTNA